MANYDNGVTLRELDPISKLTGEEQIFVDYEKAYKLTQDTVIIEGKTYYTYDPDIGIYTAVANPSIESITTYYEAVEAKRYALSRVTLDVQNEIDRIHYYGDKDIIPSDENYFTVNATGETITGLTDEGKTQTELVIPYKINGVEITGIGDTAFIYCSSLTRVAIPNSVTSIGDAAFIYCSSLTRVAIPNSVTSIGDAAFNGCSSLVDIAIPNSVTSIGDAAFNECAFKSMVIPNSITSIGSEVFMLSKLSSITIPNSVSSIDASAFSGCTNLTIYCEQGSYADTFAQEQNIAVKYTEVGQDIGLNTELKMGYDSATLIAMYNEANVTPSPEDWFIINETTGAVSINTGVFNNVDTSVYDITEIVIPWKIGNIVVKSIDTEFTNMCDYTSDITKLTMPNSVTKISDHAFYSSTWGSMEGLKSVNIPSSLKSIGNSAFRGCIALSDVQVPIKSNITVAANSTGFWGCVNLKDISPLLQCLSIINDSMFLACTGLSNVIIPENVKMIDEGSFGETNISCFTVLNKDCAIDDNAFRNQDGTSTHSYPSLIKGYSGSTAETFATAANIPFMSIEGVELKNMAPKSMVTSLVKQANKNTTRLQKYLDVGGNPQIFNQYFTLSDNGRTITGFSSFANGVITIPYEINDVNVSLASGAFKDTAGVQGLIFPDGGGNDIPNSLCENMSSLAFVHLPKYSNGTPQSILYIWNNAFKNCTHLIYVEAHSRVSIWDSAFEGCTALETLDLSCGCDYIGANAFKDCTHLKNLILPRDLPDPDESIDPTAFDGCTNLSICCEEGSNAEAFAIANDIPVRYTEISEGTLASFVTDDVIENRNQYLNFTDSVYPPEKTAYTFSDDNTTITGITTTSYTLTLPYKHNNVDVTTVGASAFEGNTSAINVTIPKNITTIESEAFSGCTGVYSVRACGNITLKSQAFSGCTSLREFTCEGNITLNSNAFEGCTSLTSIDLTNVTSVSIGANVFKDCTNLKQVIIPSKVKIINAEAFSGCTNLTIYCEPGTRADTFAQSNNIPVVYINMPASILTKRDAYYNNCFEAQKNFGRYDYNAIYTPQDKFTYSADYSTITGLNADSTDTVMLYVFPYQYDEGNYTYTPITAIGEGAFKDNTNVSAVFVPASITTINSEAFSGCTDLAQVTFYGACELGAKAFCGCGNLMSVDMKSAPSIPESAFEGTFIMEFVVPDGCTKIEANAFKDSLLGLITIPASVITIDDTAFTNCELVLITCEEGSTADRYAKNYNIPVKYTKVLKSTLDSKIDKTTITASTDGSITLADNTEFRVADTVTSISVSVPVEAGEFSMSDDFISSVVFKSGATATTISIKGTSKRTVKLCGDNVSNNVFTPVANRVYNIVFYNDGFNIVGVVGGYSS